jgi:hypothetical protein
VNAPLAHWSALGDGRRRCQSEVNACV